MVVGSASSVGSGGMRFARAVLVVPPIGLGVKDLKANAAHGAERALHD